MITTNLSEQSLRQMLDRVIKAKDVAPVAVKPTHYRIKIGNR